MITNLKKLLGLTIATLTLGIMGGLLATHPASAAGEIYTWKDYRTITVSGGDVKSPSDILLSNTPPSGDMSAVFGGNILYNKGGGNKGCTVSISIYIFKSYGDSGGRIWNPPPYDNTIIVDPNTAPRCALAGAPEMDPPLHDQWVAIGGTRPADPNAPEREEEKRFDVYVFAPDPLSKVPPSDTVYIYRKDGTRVGQQSSPFKDDSGPANWPPDQTPAAMRVTFSLEPGEYLVCDTYVAKECDYAKAPASQKFTKVKYKSSEIQLGKPFQTPDKKRINGKVEYHAKRPCGSTLNVSPINVELTGPDGKVHNQLTPPGETKPMAGEDGAICTVNVTLTLPAVFEDMAAGTYKACTTGAPCVDVTKADGQPAEFTLVVKNEQTAPPNEQVCTSGDGIAGALAWIICPATQLIASSTEFFENNIIMPFMTVSPLTTNNDNPVYRLWQNFRDLANVGFIVMLFISIFSIALSKYGLKRVLPRLLVVAVGINLSYFLVAFVIDAFNIFGAGISQLIMSALQNAGTTQLNTGTSAGPVRSIFTLGGAALLTILLTGGAAIGWLFSFLGLAALVVVALVIVLVVRQMGIIALVVLSPIAILMYLLPNTEGWFTKWRKTLIQLLMMYPMIVLLFAAGKIFGFLLQQPDFKIAGDGVTDDVAQAVRVILQFLAYVIPFVFLPATIAATNSTVARLNSALNSRLVQPRAARLRQDASQIAGESKLRMANSRIPGVKQLAGSGMRRDFVRQSKKRNLEREQQEYLAGAVSSSGFLRRQAAGVAGVPGQTRAAAGAAKTAASGRDEDLKNEMALLDNEMRRVGMDQKSFATAVGQYIADPTDPTKRVITGANGQTFDFAANESRLQRAMLNSAASSGEIGAIEAARASAAIDQTMVDDIIRRNDGTLKGKGGYHLATQFNLAAGRIQVHDPATGALRAPANQDEINHEIVAQRLVAMAQSGANSIADMKSDLIEDTASMLATPSPQRAAVLQAMTHIGTANGENYRTMLQGKINMILSTPQTRASADITDEQWRHIRDNL